MQRFKSFRLKRIDYQTLDGTHSRPDAFITTILGQRSEFLVMWKVGRGLEKDQVELENLSAKLPS